MSVFRFSPEGSWSINDFQRNSPPSSFPVLPLLFPWSCLSLNPLSPHIFILFLFCFFSLFPCSAAILALLSCCPFHPFIWGRGNLLGNPGKGENLGQEEALEGDIKKLSIPLDPFCFGDCRIAFWRSPSVMEMVQLGLSSALSGAMPCSPSRCRGKIPLSVKPCCALFSSLFPFTPAKPSAQPLSLSSASSQTHFCCRNRGGP